MQGTVCQPLLIETYVRHKWRKKTRPHKAEGAITSIDEIESWFHALDIACQKSYRNGFGPGGSSCLCRRRVVTNGIEQKGKLIPRKGRLHEVPHGASFDECFGKAHGVHCLFWARQRRPGSRRQSKGFEYVGPSVGPVARERCFVNRLYCAVLSLSRSDPAADRQLRPRGIQGRFGVGVRHRLLGHRCSYRETCLSFLIESEELVYAFVVKVQSDEVRQSFEPQGKDQIFQEMTRIQEVISISSFPVLPRASKKDAADEEHRLGRACGQV